MVADWAWIGIDPGKQGAIACATCEHDTSVFSMPPTKREQYELLDSIRGEYPGLHWVCCIEKVGNFFPSQNPAMDLKRVGALLKLRQHKGELIGFLVSLGVAIDEVMPRVWQKSVCGKLPRGQSSASIKSRKHAIRDKMQDLYPDLKLTLNNADAVAILTYCKRRYGGQ